MPANGFHAQAGLSIGDYGLMLQGMEPRVALDAL